MASWQELIFQPMGGFIVVFIGTLFLITEVLVKGRFLFGILGFLSISLYFYAHITEGHAMWMGITFVLGILFVVVDGKLIGDGTLAGIGLILMLASIAIPSPTFLYGLAVITAFILGVSASFLSMKYLPRRELWSKLALKDTLSSERGYNSMKEGYRELIGKEGVAETDFRPTGTIKIDEKLYSAVSEGRWIKKGTPLIVSHVSGVRILVQQQEETDYYHS